MESETSDKESLLNNQEDLEVGRASLNLHQGPAYPFCPGFGYISSRRLGGLCPWLLLLDLPRDRCLVIAGNTGFRGVPGSPGKSGTCRSTPQPDPLLYAWGSTQDNYGGLDGIPRCYEVSAWDSG